MANKKYTKNIWLIILLIIMYFYLYFIELKNDININIFGFLKNNKNNQNYDISIRNTGLSSAFNLLLFLIAQIISYIRHPNEYHLVPQHVKLIWKQQNIQNIQNIQSKQNNESQLNQINTISPTNDIIENVTAAVDEDRHE